MSCFTNFKRTNNRFAPKPRKISLRYSSAKKFQCSNIDIYPTFISTMANDFCRIGFFLIFLWLIVILEHTNISKKQRLIERKFLLIFLRSQFFFDREHFDNYGRVKKSINRICLTFWRWRQLQHFYSIWKNVGKWRIDEWKSWRILLNV